jgi:hypothetical protein
MDPTFLNRNVNQGFSGGEKKRNEILQLAVLDVSGQAVPWGGVLGGGPGDVSTGCAWGPRGRGGGTVSWREGSVGCPPGGGCRVSWGGGSVGCPGGECGVALWLRNHQWSVHEHHAGCGSGRQNSAAVSVTAARCSVPCVPEKLSPQPLIRHKAAWLRLCETWQQQSTDAPPPSLTQLPMLCPACVAVTG